MRYLTRVIETYRLNNEQEVEKFIKELKQDPRFEIAKYSSTKRQKKSKGEILDEWIRFEVIKIFNDENEPDNEIKIEYEKQGVY